MRSLVAVALVVLTAGLLAPAGSAPSEAAPPEAAPREVATTTREAAASAQVAARAPALRVTSLATGLAVPWDVQPIGTGEFLITERSTRRLYRVRNGRRTRVRFPSGSVWAAGETGLMSLEVDPRFRENRRFYTCQGGYRAGGGNDVRVVAWRLGDAGARARRIEVLRAGIRAGTGRHGGCRLLITRGGALLVGTGDAAVGTTPRDRTSLAGKVLRLNRMTGRPHPNNPLIDAESRRSRFVLTYGHRNVQGLAQRKDGSLWSVEHGPDRNDEVNLLKPGGDYGWHPVPEGGGAGYNESVPMTDHELPGRQRRARWRSGSPTIATSGAAWVRGEEWGRLDGRLAVAALKRQRIVFMKFDPRGRLVSTVAPRALRGIARLRSVTRAPNGSLLVTTSDSTDGRRVDRVLRVTPR
ncbi:PQQ-dependent sugar dehydrogenase [Nocardioides donggukensis]|uniref:PQQ-dependent sugar dehydrogenase n=1 Tax=Nocardioides donggukensis TaxID=2774019 RepID=A0A927K3G9_9ACTN|nr:PQQ-dependent sugar dehydrogenase [Nocardioides donggukensis]MBD8869922.1 PQQ-dependent sugar dehydrogenase [Nocardioides donggukensis]